MKYKVAAYITSYEDIQSLENCVKSIQQQSYPVKDIFIFDNSSKKITLHSNYDNIIIEHYPENLGISGGLRRGISWSVENNYDFLWTFDQDSQAHLDCLNNLIEDYKKLNNQENFLGIVAPLSIDCNTNFEICGLTFNKYKLIPSPGQNHDIYKCDVAITSGSLIPLSIARKIDLPRSDLFIDAVDWEYCFYLRKKGYQNYISKRSILYHKFSDLKILKLPFLEKTILINNYSAIRQYYICRNHTYVLAKQTQKMYIHLAILSRISYAIRTIFKIVFYESEQKPLKVWACTLGTFDGFCGRLGKTWK